MKQTLPAAVAGGNADLRPWSLGAEETLQALAGSRDGLAAAQADERLHAHGRNALRARNRKTWYQLLVHQFANPMVYLLIGAAVVKAWFKGLLDAAVIAAILIFMAVIGLAQELKAQRAMAALLKLSAPRAKVRRDGRISLLDAARVVPGDLLVVEAGDRVAADCRLLEAASLKVNESTFTGESLPVEKTVPPVPGDAALHDRSNMLFMGTTISHGRGLAVVTSTGMQTEIGRIAEAVAGAKKDRTPLQQGIDHLARSLIWIVIGACLVLVATGLLRGMAWAEVLLLTVAAAVSAIPEELPATVTVILAVSVSRMAARNVIIRKLTAVEALGTATVICSDKTGTLTLNEMTVRNLWVGGRQLTVTGSGYAPDGEFRFEGKPVAPDSDQALQRLLRVAVLCNDALLNRVKSDWSLLGDPTEGALLAAGAKAGLHKAALEAEQPRLDEIPFESEKQFMATLHSEDGQRTAYVKGSVEKLLALCSHVDTGSGERPLDDDARRAVLDANQAMAGEALRVLAIAAAPYPVNLGRLSADRLAGRLVLRGLAGMFDPPRDEARRAIQRCQRAGIRVAMITGDNPITASAIASQLGIGRSGETAMVGREIEALSDDELRTACRDRSVFARIEPLHKLRIVNAFKQNGHVAAMTGDGVNDAPALEAAGIGVAMGITGTDVAKEAADMVLADDNFASIVAAVEEGRAIFNRLRNVVFFLLLTCTAELMTILLSVAIYGESPLEPIHVLWINLVTGSLAAIPLGLEPATGRELNQPPRDPAVGLIYRGMLLRLLVLGLCTSAAITLVFHHAPLPPATDPLTAHGVRQTIAFTGIVIAEWLFAFHARSPEQNIWEIGVLRNRWLMLAMLAGLGLQSLVIYLTPVAEFFHTRPLSPVELLWAVLPGLGVVVLEMARKLLAPRLFSAGQWQRLSGPRHLPGRV
ncbi:HAD-IC family P-type ATPase [candidate division WOR-3 bacterium]|nr:HAD-IC family P-type ATPase [candidate division WOR-3 bacterium]